jgi:hypothetical protein
MARRRSMKTDRRNLDGVRSLITEVMGCGIELMEVLLSRSPDRCWALKLYNEWRRP